MRIALSDRQKELATGFFAIVMVAGGLLIAETGLRLVSYMRFGMTGPVERSERFFIDEATGLRLARPGVTAGGIGINSLGYRGPEFPAQRAEGTIRLVFLGSSTTFDAHTSDNDATWPNQTVENLRARLPGCSFDYANAGSPAYNVDKIALHFRHFVSKIKPNIVVVLASDLNKDADDLAVKRGISDGVAYRESRLARHSLVWAKVEKNLVILKRQRQAHDRRGKLSFDARELARGFENRLDNLLASDDSGATWVLLTNGSRVGREQSPRQQTVAAATVLFYMPYLTVEGFLDAHDAYNEAIVNVAARHGAILVDAYENIPKDELHYADSHHLKDAGSRQLGADLARELVAAPRFREVLRRHGGAECVAGL